jgi:hypothetical protein
MINAMVACLESEHRNFSLLIMRLAFAATRRSDGDTLGAPWLALELWSEIQRDLRSHLQIEDELVLSWGGEHHAIPAALQEAIRKERQEIRRLTASLAEIGVVEPISRENAAPFAQALLNLAHALDSHVERYDSEVLPAIRRAAFHR